MRAREAVSFLSGAGEELGYLRFVAVWGGRKAMSFTCANMGSGVEMSKVFLYTI